MKKNMMKDKLINERPSFMPPLCNLVEECLKEASDPDKALSLYLLKRDKN